MGWWPCPWAPWQGSARAGDTRRAQVQTLLKHLYLLTMAVIGLQTSALSLFSWIDNICLFSGSPLLLRQPQSPGWLFAMEW